MQWLRCSATNRKVAGSIPDGVIGIFHWHKILPIALWPWGQLSLWQKRVPEVFPGGKCGRCIRLITLPLSCAIVMKSENLYFLEPSGPLQACNGTALPLYRSIMFCYFWCCNVLKLSSDSCYISLEQCWGCEEESGLAFIDIWCREVRITGADRGKDWRL